MKVFLSLFDESADTSFFARFARVGLIVLLLTSFFIAYYPVMDSLVTVWTNSEDYSHGFFIPPIVLYLIWIKRESLCPQQTQPHWPGIVVVLIALFAYIFAIFAKIQTLASLSMIACLIGAVLFLFGTGTAKELIFPFFLLLFMVPVPAQIYARLTISLQLFITKISSIVAEIFQIPVYRAGNIIETPGLALQVIDACSGMRSMISLLLLSALFAFFTLQTRLGRLVLFLSGIPVAIFINIFRVVGIFCVWHFFNYDLTHGLQHKIFGIFLFIAALAILFIIKKGMLAWERKISSE